MGIRNAHRRSAPGYGKEVTPVEILVKGSVSNKGADPLREELKKAQ